MQLSRMGPAGTSIPCSLGRIPGVLAICPRWWWSQIHIATPGALLLHVVGMQGDKWRGILVCNSESNRTIAGLRQALPPQLFERNYEGHFCVCVWFPLSLEPTCPKFSLIFLFLLYFTFFALMLFPQMQT